MNNALGSALPLVQDLLQDARDGHLDSSGLVQDLERLKQAIDTTCGVFRSMLGTARPSTGAVHEAMR